MPKNKELTAQQIAELNEAYPVSDDSARSLLPRFGMLSKDITEETGTGKKKTIKVVESAGTFYIEKDKGEIGKDGKKKWTREYIGEKVDVIIAFHRRQLRLFDASLKKFISSPIFDSKDQVIPLYLDKRVIAMGTQEALQNIPAYKTKTEKGKDSSKLKEEAILYVIYKEELYQFNISQSSKWVFSDYKKGLNPSTVLTTLGSVEDKFGTNTFRKVTFTSKGLIDQDEFELVKEYQGNLATQVKTDAKNFLKAAENKQLGAGKKAQDDFDAVGAEAGK